MPEYDVHLRLVVRTKVVGVGATNRDAAIERAIQECGIHALPAFTSHGLEFEFDDDIAGALVDVVGDENYDETTYHVQAEGRPFLCQQCGMEAEWPIEVRGVPASTKEYHCPFCWEPWKEKPNGE